jgi:uncharacterized protein YbaP (TraB family)
MQIAMKRRIPFVLLLMLLLSSGSGSVHAQQDGALYWAISRDGEPAGYLLGTVHSEDPRVLDFTEAFASQLDANQVFAMEMVPDLPTLTRLTEYMHYQDGTTLEQHVGAERFARVRAALADYRVPPDWIARMKVWAAMMTLSVPPPRTGLFMDFSLSLRAAGAGLKVVGLETLEQQLSFLEKMPDEQQLSLLDQALDEHGRVGEVHDQMVDSYLAGDLQALVAQVDEQLEELSPEARRYFMAQGIEARNQRMLSSALPLLKESRVFIAVGALHLPGDQGLIALLRREGYELSPLPLPLSAAQGRGEPAQDSDHKTANAP